MLLHLVLWNPELQLESTRTAMALRQRQLSGCTASMTEAGGTARYRDIIELIGADRRLLRSCVLGDDGLWTEFMRAEYRRV